MNFKTEKMIVILLVSTLVSSVLAISIPKVQAETTAVKVMPQALEFGPDPCVGTEFTITVEVQYVSDLYGFDTQFGWNTSYIRYVSRTLHTPVETYPDGILHGPTMTIRNTVNEAGIPGTMPGTMYWAAASSMPPASPFEGSGIAFDMTFTIVNQPGYVEADAVFDLKIIRSQLSDHFGWPIVHSMRSATVTIYALRGPGDVNNDGIVDIFDIGTISAHWYPGPPIGPLGYSAVADINLDGSVDIFDIGITSANWGNTYP